MLSLITVVTQEVDAKPHKLIPHRTHANLTAAGGAVPCLVLEQRFRVVVGYFGRRLGRAVIVDVVVGDGC